MDDARTEKRFESHRQLNNGDLRFTWEGKHKILSVTLRKFVKKEFHSWINSRQASPGSFL